MRTIKKISVKPYVFRAGATKENKVTDFKMKGNLIIAAVIFFVLTAALLFSLTPDKTIETDGNTALTTDKNTFEKLEYHTDQPNIASEIPAYLQNYIDQNPDTVGYIRIEGTCIDYPVVQSDNNSYYMDRNFKTCPNKSGTIFLDFRCDANDFSKTRNMIIYGHRMKDGSMFKDLTKYQDKEFFLENRIIEFDTKSGEYEWKVFAVLETTTDFYYIDTEFPYDAVWLAFLDEVKSHSIYETHTNFYPNDIVLTLSTCMTEEDGRLVVMAKLKQ